MARVSCCFCFPQLIKAMGVLVFLAALPGLPAGTRLHAQDYTSVQGEFWVDQQPMGPDGPLPRLSLEASLKITLEEVRYVFSGMIYGWSFEYRPLDDTRQVEDSFEVKPQGSIAAGDPDLEYRESREDESFRYYRIRYLLKEHEMARLEAISSVTVATAAAEGGATYFKGTGQKIEALKSGLKEAVRAYARPRMQNKPSWLKGRIWLEVMPLFRVNHGEYRAIVRVKIILDDLGPYKTF